MNMGADDEPGRRMLPFALTARRSDMSLDPVPSEPISAILALSRNDDVRPPSRLFAGFDRWLSRFLLHSEDAFVVRHMGAFMLVCAFGAYANFNFSWLYAALFYGGILANGEAAGRFLHIFSHRKVFAARAAWLNTAPTWIASGWFGEPPYLFGAEHVANHHAADNGPRDIGSTLWYRRDSWAALGRYLLDFFCGGGGIFGLLRFFRAGRGGRVWRRRFFAGEALFWGLVAVRLWQDWLPTTALLIGPFFFVQAVNRANNWTEHAFINPERPHDPLGNSYTIVGSRFNTGTGFNEGYHATHHLSPGLPNHLWPKHFRDHIADYVAADHLVFQKTSTNDIFFMLMCKDFRALARYYVPLPGRTRSEAEIIRLLRERVAPFPRSADAHAAAARAA
jgi:fatty acid desaturase